MPVFIFFFFFFEKLFLPIYFITFLNKKVKNEHIYLLTYMQKY